MEHHLLVNFRIIGRGLPPPGRSHRQGSSFQKHRPKNRSRRPNQTSILYLCIRLARLPGVFRFSPKQRHLEVFYSLPHLFSLGASQIFVNFVLSSLGNTVSFCSGGACNSFYISTLSSFFSAFGIPIA